MEQFIDQLLFGETYEIPEIYIGMYQKIPARLFLYKVTETQMKRRQKDLASKEHKKQITYKERSKRLSAINFYITNIPFGIPSKGTSIRFFTPYNGKLNLSLKHGNHFFVFITVIL